MKTSEGLRNRSAPARRTGAASLPTAGFRSPTVRPESTAAYIADITTELAGLARSSKLDILAYLLDIAQLEAANSVRRLTRESCVR